MDAKENHETKLNKGSNENASKVKALKPKSVALKKVDIDTAKAIQSLKEKINKKSFGRKVRDAEIIGLGISLIGPEHIKILQESTYTEKDRLQIAHEEYSKANGKTTLDQFANAKMRSLTTKRWLRTDEVALYLGSTCEAIKKLYQRGNLSASKFCGRLYFDRERIDQLIENSKPDLAPEFSRKRIEIPKPRRR